MFTFVTQKKKRAYKSVFRRSSQKEERKGATVCHRFSLPLSKSRNLSAFRKPRKILSEMKKPQTVETIESNLKKFGIFDYVVFIGMLVGCALIGIYYAFKGKKSKDNVNEYLMGGRQMSTFPVAMSLIASFISGITLLGAPTEIYLHGTEYTFVLISIIIMGFFASYLFLPIFHEMQLFSTYEYLEKRFDKNVRLLGSIMFTMSQIFWLPIVIYVPALAFNQVTGVNIHIITPFVCLVCVFYTCLGGLKAVVWTDVIQMWFMLGSIILVCIKGTYDVGGFSEVWRRSAEGERLIVPSFELDLTIRHSFWSVTLGGLAMWIQGSIINQNVLQRYLSLPSLSHARWALWIFVVGTSLLILLCSYVGLVIYATYHDCDPLTTKLAKAKDQVLPVLVMRVLSHLPGLPGLFVAGIFSASLSSLSTGLNSMSAVVLEDFVKTYAKKKLSKRMTKFIMQGVVLVFGALFLALVFLVEKLGTVLQLSISLGSVTNGPVLGIFICGLFLPRINSKGALFGGLLGLLGSGFVIIGAQNAIGSNALKFTSRPTSVEGCQYYYNATVLSDASEVNADRINVFPLFRLSYFWYTALGCLLTIICAIFVSGCTGFTQDKDVDPICFSPMVRKRICRTKSQCLRLEEQELINKLKKENI